MEKEGQHVMKTLNEIKKDLSALKKELHERYGVSNIEIFGSYVRMLLKEPL